MTNLTPGFLGEWSGGQNRKRAGLISFNMSKRGCPGVCGFTCNNCWAHTWLKYFLRDISTSPADRNKLWVLKCLEMSAAQPSGVGSSMMERSLFMIVQSPAS